MRALNLRSLPCPPQSNIYVPTSDDLGERIINVDYTGEGNHQGKTGFAATGDSSSDYWNEVFPTLTPSKEIDIRDANGDLIDVNDGNGSTWRARCQPTQGMGGGTPNDAVVTDDMHKTRCQGQGGFIPRVRAAYYDVYIYGHGDDAGEYSVYKELWGPNETNWKYTSYEADWWNNGTWEEDRNYMVFRGMLIDRHQAFSDSLSHGHTQMLNGVQLVRQSDYLLCPKGTPSFVNDGYGNYNLWITFTAFGYAKTATAWVTVSTTGTPPVDPVPGSVYHHTQWLTYGTAQDVVTNLNDGDIIKIVYSSEQYENSTVYQYTVPNTGEDDQNGFQPYNWDASSVFKGIRFEPIIPTLGVLANNTYHDWASPGSIKHLFRFDEDTTILGGAIPLPQDTMSSLELTQYNLASRGNSILADNGGLHHRSLRCDQSPGAHFRESTGAILKLVGRSICIIFKVTDANGKTDAYVMGQVKDVAASAEGWCVKRYNGYFTLFYWDGSAEQTLISTVPIRDGRRYMIWVSEESGTVNFRVISLAADSTSRDPSKHSASVSFTDVADAYVLGAKFGSGYEMDVYLDLLVAFDSALVPYADDTFHFLWNRGYGMDPLTYWASVYTSENPLNYGYKGPGKPSSDYWESYNTPASTPQRIGVYQQYDWSETNAYKNMPFHNVCIGRMSGAGGANPFTYQASYTRDGGNWYSWGTQKTLQTKWDDLFGNGYNSRPIWYDNLGVPDFNTSRWLSEMCGVSLQFFDSTSRVRLRGLEVSGDGAEVDPWATNAQRLLDGTMIAEAMWTDSDVQHIIHMRSPTSEQFTKIRFILGTVHQVPSKFVLSYLNTAVGEWEEFHTESSLAWATGETVIYDISQPLSTTQWMISFAWTAAGRGVQFEQINFSVQ